MEKLGEVKLNLEARPEEQIQKELWAKLENYKKLVLSSSQRIPGVLEVLQFSWNKLRDVASMSLGEKIKRRRPARSWRGEDVIGDLFGIDYKLLMKEYKSKNVLDIGPGGSHFSTQMQEDGINVFTVDIDPKAYWSRTDGVRYRRTKDVLGRADTLSFKDESMDGIFASYSLPYWAMSSQEIDRFISECLRVVKKGCKIYISPIFGFDERVKLLPNNILGRFGEEEDDKTIIRKLRKMQVYFIEKLEYLNQSNVAEVKLIKWKPLLGPDTNLPVKDRPPQSVIIVKR